MAWKTRKSDPDPSPHLISPSFNLSYDSDKRDNKTNELMRELAPPFDRRHFNLNLFTQDAESSSSMAAGPNDINELIDSYGSQR